MSKLFISEAMAFMVVLDAIFGWMLMDVLPLTATILIMATLMTGIIGLNIVEENMEDGKREQES